MQASHQGIFKPRSRSPSPNPLNRLNRDSVQISSTTNCDADDIQFLSVNGSSSSENTREVPVQHIQQSGNTLVINSMSHMGSGEFVPECVNRYNRQDCCSSGEMDELNGGVNNKGSNNYGSISNEGSSINTAHCDNTADCDADISSTQGSTLQSSTLRLKRQKSYYTPAMVDTLRKRNRLYFVDPITKLKKGHSFPWKMTLQIIKIVMVTAQVIIFDSQRQNMIDYFERNDLSFKHLLLNKWDPSFETMPYPPATGQYALYSLTELYNHIDFVSENYYKLPDSSLSSMHLYKDDRTGEIDPIKLCFWANKFEEFENGSYIIDADLLHNCYTIEPYGSGENRTYSIEKYLRDHNLTLPFNRTLSINLKMNLRTFHLNLLETHYGPTCYDVCVNVTYLNTARSGQLLVDLVTRRHEIKCVGKILSQDVRDETDSLKLRYMVFDAAVMVCCILSTILCARSLMRSNQLRKDTAKFFHLQKGRPFRFSNHLEFINKWYIIIIINDILTCVGSAMKIQLQNRAFSISSENYGYCSMLLGTGIFLTYVGILRYLGFFKTYNVLILTLQTSFPHVVRFLVCALCLYSGFLFCGWVVFSPYHIKFRKLSTSSECLFSLVNGDDMFVTFSALDNNSNYIWYFHRGYLYIFISLFIYVVLSVFIAVIMDNYEELKKYHEEGFPLTEVEKFIKENGDMPESELFSHVKRDGSWQSWLFCLFPCLACLRSEKKRKSRKSSERQELVGTI